MQAGEDNDAGECASPPCAAHRVPAVPGAAELIAWLNTLVEAERAGAQGVSQLARRAADPGLAATLKAIARDEARFCALLSRHVARLGGTPSLAAGAFLDKLLARETLAAQLALLDRGQAAVVHLIEERLPRVEDPLLAADLAAMRDDHLANLARAAALVPAAAGANVPTQGK